jgi:hypothetical protein
MVFFGLNGGEFQYLFLVSGPGNQNDLLVALNVSSPMGVPSPNP